MDYNEGFDVFNLSLTWVLMRLDNLWYNLTQVYVSYYISSIHSLLLCSIIFELFWSKNKLNKILFSITTRTVNIDCLNIIEQIFVMDFNMG